MWLILAATQEPDAVGKRDLAASEMTPDEIDEAERLAREWNAEAYEVIARTLALGTVACEPQPNENGERVIWIEERRLDKLNSIRRSGESYSERLAALWEGHWTHKRR
jgi:hypothetical protein